jgi:ketosteroid isomerase-like protein
MVMKKKALVLCICIFFANVGFTQGKTAKGKAGTRGVTKELIVRSLDAWSTMDPDKIAPYYSKAPDNIFFDIAPMEYRGWAEWAKGVHNLFADYKIFKFTLADEPAIHNLGNWAWSTELFHVDAVHKDGKTETIDGRDTAVWQKQGGEWLIVHEHDSVPLAMPATDKK